MKILARRLYFYFSKKSFRNFLVEICTVPMNQVLVHKPSGLSVPQGAKRGQKPNFAKMSITLKVCV